MGRRRSERRRIERRRLKWWRRWRMIVTRWGWRMIIMRKSERVSSKISSSPIRAILRLILATSLLTLVSLSPRDIVSWTKKYSRERTVVWKSELDSLWRATTSWRGDGSGKVVVACRRGDVGLEKLEAWISGSFVSTWGEIESSYVIGLVECADDDEYV